MNYSIKVLKDELSFNQTPSIVSLKKQIKLISKQINRPLNKIQEAVTQLYGYGSWYGFRAAFFNSMRPKNGKDVILSYENHHKFIDILSKDKPKVIKQKKEKPYLLFAHHALLDESLWIDYDKLKLHTSFYLNSDEVHVIYKKIYEQFISDKSNENNNFLFSNPNLKQIEDLEQINRKKNYQGDYAFTILDLSRNQDLKDTKYKNNIGQILFDNLEQEVMAFLHYEYGDNAWGFKDTTELQAVQGDSDSVQKIIEDKIVLPENITISEVLEKYKHFCEQEFIFKEKYSKNFAIQIKNWFSVPNDIIIYFGDEIEKKCLDFFNYIRYLSMKNLNLSKSNKYHFFYHKREIIDFYSRACGIACFQLEDGSPFKEQKTASVVYKPLEKGDYWIEENILFYESTLSYRNPIPICFENKAQTINIAKIEKKLMFT